MLFMLSFERLSCVVTHLMSQDRHNNAFSGRFPDAVLASDLVYYNGQEEFEDMEVSYRYLKTALYPRCIAMPKLCYRKFIR